MQVVGIAFWTYTSPTSQKDSPKKTCMQAHNSGKTKCMSILNMPRLPLDRTQNLGTRHMGWLVHLYPFIHYDVAVLSWWSHVDIVGNLHLNFITFKIISFVCNN